MRADRPHLSALIASLVVACGPSRPAPDPPQTLDDGVVLEWNVSQGLWGTERLTVRGDGTAHYVFEPVSGSSDPPADGSAQLTPTDLAQARDALRDANACSLDATRPGVPDEARTHLRIAMADDLRCSVEVWDNDWRERAPEVESFIRAWIARARGD